MTPAAMTPGGIEAQEKAGQIEQSFKETLPIDGTSGQDREQWEKIGFAFHAMADDLFVFATFPKGWRKKPADHAMWTEILDDKGRKRGMIFYKAAFYDRSAHAHLESRFSVACDYKKPTATVSIRDACGQVNKSVSFEYDYHQADSHRDVMRKWLAENYPDWQAPLAYWD